LTSGRRGLTDPIEGPVLHLRLNEQLERLRQEPTWHASSRNAITVAKGRALRMVLMLLSQGSKISEHQGRQATDLPRPGRLG
jgi:hypothetical protein